MIESPIRTILPRRKNVAVLPAPPSVSFEVRAELDVAIVESNISDKKIDLNLDLIQGHSLATRYQYSIICRLIEHTDEQRCVVIAMRHFLNPQPTHNGIADAQLKKSMISIARVFGSPDFLALRKYFSIPIIFFVFNFL